MEDAKRQDAELCSVIIAMRQYARVSMTERTAPQQLKIEDYKFMHDLEKAAGVDED